MKFGIDARDARCSLSKFSCEPAVAIQFQEFQLMRLFTRAIRDTRDTRAVTSTIDFNRPGPWSVSDVFTHRN